MKNSILDNKIVMALFIISCFVTSNSSLNFCKKLTKTVLGKFFKFDFCETIFSNSNFVILSRFCKNC